MQEIYLLAEELSVSQEGLCLVELDIWTRLCHKMNCDYNIDDNGDCNVRQVSVLYISDYSKSNIPVTCSSSISYYTICISLQIKLMATVHQTQPMIQLLLSTPDYVAALDLISTTQEILVQELAGVHSFR